MTTHAGELYRCAECGGGLSPDGECYYPNCPDGRHNMREHERTIRSERERIAQLYEDSGAMNT